MGLVEEFDRASGGREVSRRNMESVQSRWAVLFFFWIVVL